MATRLKPSRINVDNTPHVGEGAAYKSDDDFHWSMGGGDMSYRDFEWNTLTGNSITIEDISNNITPSSDFTISAGTELKPGIEYVLRVNTGNTPYTMTLGTGVTNPNSYKTELKPNTINQFKFIATSISQLELEGVDSAVVSEINWGEIDGTLSNQTDLQNALNSKADATDVNTKTFHVDSGGITEAQEAYDWHMAGNTAIIEYGGTLYYYTSTSSSNLYFEAVQPTRETVANEYTRLKYAQIILNVSGSTVTGVTVGTYRTTGIQYLSTNLNDVASYTFPYVPTSDGAPATKKYVDDQVSAATAGAVSDTAYGSSWDGVTGIAPSKNAIYDKISTMDTAISGNTTNINTINGKIPSEASASNQLADKDFVGDSINSVTAYYITKNAQGDQFATYAELAAATTFYSGGVVRVPTKNDYTIVLSDENHDNATTRYIYNNGWEYQYTVNETALTQAQLNAINSGITAAKVTQYDGYATGKQDVLTAGDNININNNVISADVNTKTFPLSGLGSSAQVLEDAQAIYDWYVAGNNPLIIYNNRQYALFSTTNGLWFASVEQRRETDSSGEYSIIQGKGIVIHSSGSSVTNVFEGFASTVPAKYLDVTVDYPTAYTPQYDGSPATKKYVDDNAFAPGGTATTGYVVTKTASGYDWQAPSGGDAKVFTITGTTGSTNLATATEAYTYAYTTGKCAIIRYNSYNYVYARGSTTSAYFTRVYGNGAVSSGTWASIGTLKLTVSSGSVTAIASYSNVINVSSSAPSSSTTNGTITLVI